MAEIPGNQGTPENPVGGSAPQQYQPVASGFQPVSAQPPAPPAKSGGNAMKIILIILGIFAFLILLLHFIGHLLHLFSRLLLRLRCFLTVALFQIITALLHLLVYTFFLFLRIFKIHFSVVLLVFFIQFIQ